MNKSTILAICWQKYLFWYQHSLWANWLWLPLIGAAVLAPFFVQTQYADLYDVVSKTPTFTVEGKVKSVGVKAGKHIEIESDHKVYVAYCSPLLGSGQSCIPKNAISEKLNYKVSLVNYRNILMIVSISYNNRIVLGEDDQIFYIKKTAEQAEKIDYWYEFYLVFVSLFFLCIFRYVFFIRKRRKLLALR